MCQVSRIHPAPELSCLPQWTSVIAVAEVLVQAMALRSQTCSLAAAGASLLLLLAQVSAQSSWAICEDAPGSKAVQVASVKLEPDPPIIGSPAKFIVEGTSGVPIQAGTVDIAVSFGGIQIFEQSEDLCGKTSCPTMPGPVVVTIVEDLPPIAPPGDYGLRVTCRDATGADLLCLDVNFQLVLPSAAVQQQQQQQQHSMIRQLRKFGQVATV